MHLRAIRIRGFKSFPEPVEVRLEPGVAVVVGPNGSGKSNVADALLWASGSLSPNELRAEKPDDVLFSGSGGRQPAPYCQVELVLDNEDDTLAELPAEVSVMRRVHRGGEGQYLINGTAVRRTDLVELLADVGLGGAAGSVISQGKVEQILASKPEERRALVEEAAGLGKFKRRRHRAELKLARVGQDVARARDIEAEVKKRLRPLALQASAAQRAEKLGGEIASLEAALATLDLAGIDDGSARRRSGERRPTTRSGGRSPSSRRCSPSGTAPRRSSPTPPASGRLQRPRSTGSRARRAAGAAPRERGRARRVAAPVREPAPASDRPFGGRAAPPEAARGGRSRARAACCARADACRA